MLSKELEFTLNAVFKYALEQRHALMTVEHLLLHLLDNSSALALLEACGAQTERLRRCLVSYVKAHTPSDPNSETHPTLGFQRTLQRAVFHVQSSGRSEVTGADVLAALFSEQDSQAVYLLEHMEQVSRLDIVDHRVYGQPRLSAQDMPDQEASMDMDETSQMANTQHADRSVLSQCTVDLNALAQQGKLDPVVGRTSELQRMIQVLCRRRKNNPLLLGQPGVGKTAIAEGLAQCIVQRKVPDSLAQAKVYLFNMLPMLSGTKYRGDLEKKLKTLLQQLQQEPGAILFVDDIHNLVGAGAASGGGVDLASLIKPMLSSGAIRCIGATHYQAYQGIFEKASGLTRLFQTIDVHEASIETTVHILQGLRSRLEAHHGVRYAANALRAAAELGDRYLRDRCLPDKAIDIVDEAGSCQHARPGAQRKRRVDTADVERVVARMAQVPPHKVSRRDKDKLAHLERNLKMVVFGQDRAIESLASAMVLSRSGLRDVRRPMGCFLLAGPTGVGKTEVGRQLAHALDMELIRFDMSEYMEQHTVSRLIGAPPGYVGFDQGGLLNDAVHRQPHAVLLLDEIEKAHPDVFNLLLQVMDHGTLTDHNGRATDFRHTIVLMTTNAGARDMARASVGFKVQDHSSDGMQAIQSQFPAEFRNRLDDILTFQPLSMETVSMVVDKFLSELEGQLSVKGVVLHVTTEARAWLCTQGYDLTMGARPMARVIQQHIKHPLAKALLFGPLLHGGCVTVEAAGERLALDCKARALVRSRARG